jgi:hypothetical protein
MPEHQHAACQLHGIAFGSFERRALPLFRHLPVFRQVRVARTNR